ncbi:MAG: Squalene/phytoene synthase [Candidatus Tokpelaia hoelldobleri]|uniref:Squalene/phytoene synthase n=1 Tax=Candidatus Tokpelaia hoelldobleri TaxID=1902579 RepID=A0A1U9JU11_9HYPH|nr:MAG: Squalene/phytoene synthase [Candidatus Tokpelaia hoelldoblerii]
MADDCLNLLRGGDYDRYISTLFAPRDKRADLAALYAFNLEIARIGQAVKEPLAGEIRLRWWRDCLEAGEGQGQHPVLAALQEAIKRCHLPVSAFLRMCDARIFDLYHDAMPSRNDLEGYCGDTTALVMQLACRILDETAAGACADACGHGGVALGVCGILQHLPQTTARDQLYIPQELLSAVGATREGLRASPPDKDMRQRTVQVLLALAGEHYHSFIRAFAALPVSVRVAFLPLAPVAANLKQVEKAGAQAFEHTVALPRLRRQWLIWRTAVSGRLGIL